MMLNARRWLAVLTTPLLMLPLIGSASTTLGAPVTVRYSSGDLTVAIPDAGQVDHTIAVPADGAISDLKVRVRLDHAYDAEVELSLIGPDGTTAVLSANNGGTGEDYGTGPNTCSGTLSTFDQAATTSIIDGTAPFAGTYRPEDSLTRFAGKPANGTWTLRVADALAGDVGTLGCWQLDITRDVPPTPSPSPSPSPVPPGRPNPAPAPNCTPRPPVDVSVTRLASGGLRVTITVNGENNAIREVRFGVANNLEIDIPGRASAAGGSFTHAPPVASQHLTFVIRRQQAGGAATAPLIVVDGCGEWRTFVGGGSAAF